MQDPEFEKAVRQKMEELNFNPPAALWEKVEIEIKNKKRSKRPLIWFFLFLGIALAGGSYFVLSGGSKGSSRLTGASGVRDRTSTDSGRKLENPTSSRIGTKRNEVSKNKAGIDPIAVKTQKITRLSTGAVQILKRHYQNKEGIRPVSLSEQSGQENNQSKKNPAITNQIESSQQNGIAGNEIRTGNTAGSKTIPSLPQPDPILSKIYPDSAEASQKANKLFPQTHSSDSAAKAGPSITQQKKMKKKNPWTLGFTLSPGISTVEKGIFQSSAATDRGVYSTNPGTGPSYGYSPAPSRIQPGFSFAGGLFIQKYLGERFSIMLGLNYHYYSTSINTGNKIDSSSSSYAGNPFNLSGSTTIYYLSGSTETYTNHFHFIELPVLIQIQINKSRRLPISLEEGISVSQLIGSNALQYDQASGFYFKDNGLINKTQLGASSAVLIGFLRQHGHLFQAGPELQYGITNLSKNSPGVDQHFMYYGIKLTWSAVKSGL